MRLSRSSSSGAWRETASLLGAGLFAVAGGNPLAAYAVMFTEPLKDPFGISETLVRATPLMLVAVGVAISFRSGILNIGGEGQILIGAVAGAFVGLALPDLPKFLLIPLIRRFLTLGVDAGTYYARQVDDPAHPQ